MLYGIEISEALLCYQFYLQTWYRWDESGPELAQTTELLEVHGSDLR